MRKVTIALALITMAGLSYADDPNPNVDKIVAEIAARRAAKDEAQTKAVQANARAEWGERTSSTLPPGAPGTSGGQGTTIVIQGDDD